MRRGFLLGTLRAALTAHPARPALPWCPMAATASPLEMTIGRIYDVELSATPGDKTVCVPTKNARYVNVRSVGQDSRLYRPAEGGTDFATLPADTLRTFRVPGSGSGRARNMDSAAAASNSRRFELAHPTVASVIIQVQCVEE